MIEKEILDELKSIRSAIEALVNTRRYQSVPEASKTLGLPASRIRKACNDGVIPCSIISNTAEKKRYLVDIMKTREVLNAGGLINLLLRKQRTKRATK
jgi:hypothetical protein